MHLRLFSGMFAINLSTLVFINIPFLHQAGAMFVYAHSNSFTCQLLKTPCRLMCSNNPVVVK